MQYSFLTDLSIEKAEKHIHEQKMQVVGKLKLMPTRLATLFIFLQCPSIPSLDLQTLRHHLFCFLQFLQLKIYLGIVLN